MHNSAMINAGLFYEKFCKDNIENKKILDIGSYDVYGTLKPIFSKGNYIGMDIEPGPNVDFVGNGNDIPFKDCFFDIVVSSSCFEHDDMFWLTFNEMCRVVKPGGYLYINAPSDGPYHGHPTDNWRFYIDAWKALEKWANKSGYNIKLLENYIDNDHSSNELWKDSVGIYIKN